MPNAINVIGQRFEKLTVLSDGPRNRAGRKMVTCLCDCGNTKDCEPRVLRSGHVKSCGCYQKQIVSKISRARTTHGMTKTTAYQTWIKIRGRCQNARNAKYPEYGGRGIKVCERWDKSFEAFYADMGDKPSPQHSIDRINNDGDYAADNCRWATPLMQSRNKRNHRIVEYKGRSMPLSEACELSGVNYRSALYRINNGKPWQPLPPLPTDEAEDG